MKNTPQARGKDNFSRKKSIPKPTPIGKLI
jgi:hypothetical protein